MEEQNNIRKGRISFAKIVVSVSWVLYITSLFLPCIIYKYRLGEMELLGRHILFSGYLAILYGNLGWFANPFFWLATFGFLRSKSHKELSLTAVLAAISFIIALYSLSTEKIWFDDNYRKVIDFGIGYYFWLASITILLVIIIVDLKIRFYKK